MNAAEVSLDYIFYSPTMIKKFLSSGWGGAGRSKSFTNPSSSLRKLCEEDVGLGHAWPKGPNQDSE